MNIISELLDNNILWIALLSWAIAQIIKVIIDLFRAKTIRISLLISSGGMPSSHSSFVMALTTSIGIQDGFNSSIFAVAAILSMIVMYDASGVRRAAGKQAEVINMLVETLDDKGVSLDRKLKELLGHTPVEVAAGALLGIIVGIICT